MLISDLMKCFLTVDVVQLTISVLLLFIDDKVAEFQPILMMLRWNSFLCSMLKVE